MVRCAVMSKGYRKTKERSRAAPVAVEHQEEATAILFDKPPPPPHNNDEGERRTMEHDTRQGHSH